MQGLIPPDKKFGLTPIGPLFMPKSLISINIDIFMILNFRNCFINLYINRKKDYQTISLKV